MWDPGRAFLLIISAVNICVGQLSIKNSLLAERKDWIEPSSRFENTAIDEIRTEEARQHEQADELTPDRHAILDSGILHKLLNSLFIPLMRRQNV